MRRTNTGEGNERETTANRDGAEKTEGRQTVEELG